MGVQFWQGKVLFVDRQVAMHEQCCCGDPCANCGSDQPSALLTRSGSCDFLCTMHEGTYTFSSHYNWDTECWWDLLNENGCIMRITYDKALGVYNVVVLGNPPSVPARYAADGAAITCVVGHLVGTFEAPGTGYCEGCVATITLEAGI